ncbi:hypothetical protein [Microbulbifer halophilus]|uniref:Uncharacterized protein n=1 Tax=Microbulbifer halophilus TaxID=453963 RepID=A0ABW5EF67_9GAMM|nr:hypothetical protein [Microbulbifer halophilus]MCW8127831.1 hypothetical protein [Microbulbifer halophilus]
MAHVITSSVIAFLAGLLAFYFGGRAVHSKARKRNCRESQLQKFLRESKESGFALIAGFSLCLPTLYAITEEPKRVALIVGGLVWATIVSAAAWYWYKEFPDVFHEQQ